MNSFVSNRHSLIRVHVQTALAALSLAIFWPGMQKPAQAADVADLIAPGAVIKKLAGDCKFTEGPAYGPQGLLLFSDIPNNRIVQLSPDGAVSDFLNPSGQANGLMFDAAGRLYICQGGARQVSRIDDLKSPRLTVLCDSFGGKKLNSPNDLVLDDHGGVYFTDPRYGGGDPVEQPVMGVYYIDKAGKTTRVIDSLKRPNGILISADGKTLYIAEPDARQLYSFPIQSRGKVGDAKLLFTGDADIDGGGPDGMSIDQKGNLYTTYTGIVVLRSTGELIGRIPVPERPANCAFGGKENKTLFITARTSLYAIEMRNAGLPLQRAPDKSQARAKAELIDGSIISVSAGIIEGCGIVADQTPLPVMQSAVVQLALADEKPKDDKPAEKTKEVVAKAITLSVPESWKQKAQSNDPRVAEFEIPSGVEGQPAAELVVFFFGQRGAGGLEANTERWIGQFEAEGRKVRTFTGKSSQGTYTLVDLTGTYKKSIGPPIQKKSRKLENWRVLNVFLVTENGPYFLKIDGHEKTIARLEQQFRKSFGATADEEEQNKSEK